MSFLDTLDRWTQNFRNLLEPPEEYAGQEPRVGDFPAFAEPTVYRLFLLSLSRYYSIHSAPIIGTYRAIASRPPDYAVDDLILLNAEGDYINVDNGSTVITPDPVAAHLRQFPLNSASASIEVRSWRANTANAGLGYNPGDVLTEFIDTGTGVSSWNLNGTALAAEPPIAERDLFIGERVQIYWRAKIANATLGYTSGDQLVQIFDTTTGQSDWVHNGVILPSTPPQAEIEPLDQDYEIRTWRANATNAPLGYVPDDYLTEIFNVALGTSRWVHNGVLLTGTPPAPEIDLISGGLRDSLTVEFRELTTGFVDFAPRTWKSLEILAIQGSATVTVDPLGTPTSRSIGKLLTPNGIKLDTEGANSTQTVRVQIVGTSGQIQINRSFYS